MYPLAAGAACGTNEALDTEGEEEPRGLVESREQPSAKIWTLKELKSLGFSLTKCVCAQAGEEDFVSLVLEPGGGGLSGFMTLRTGVYKRSLWLFQVPRPGVGTGEVGIGEKWLPFLQCPSFLSAQHWVPSPSVSRPLLLHLSFLLCRGSVVVF